MEIFFFKLLKDHAGHESVAGVCRRIKSVRILV